jgi:hypothetical protein
VCPKNFAARFCAISSGRAPNVVKCYVSVQARSIKCSRVCPSTSTETSKRHFSHVSLLLPHAASSPRASSGYCCGSSGFHGVRARPNGTFYAELHAGDFRLTLGTSDVPELSVRAYDAAAWQFRRPRADLNFPEVECLEEARGTTPRHRRGPSPPPLGVAPARHRRARRAPDAAVAGAVPGPCPGQGSLLSAQRAERRVIFGPRPPLMTSRFSSLFY